MSVQILDGSTILNFVNDDEAFNTAVRQRFEELDADSDGVLSYAEMFRELQSLRVLDLTDDIEVNELSDPAKDNELYRSLFAQFDRDSDGVVSPEDYAAETKELMVAIAGGLGFSPIQMVLEKDSLFMKALEREASLGTTYL